MKSIYISFTLLTVCAINDGVAKRTSLVFCLTLINKKGGEIK